MTAKLNSTTGLKKDAKSFLKQIEKGVGQAQQKLAHVAIDALLANSPVWTGTYVESFRASIGSVDSSYKPYSHGTPPFPPRLSPSEAASIKKDQAAKLKSLIAKARPFSRILISNSLPYAYRVEYYGWPEFGQGPHCVFQLGVLVLTSRAKNLNLLMGQVN